MKEKLNKSYERVRDKRIKELNRQIRVSIVLLYIVLLLITVFSISIFTRAFGIDTIVFFLVDMGYITYVVLFTIPKIIRKIEIRSFWLGSDDEISDNDNL